MNARIDAAIVSSAEAEATRRLLLYLIAELEDVGAIDGPSFTSRLRRSAAALRFEGQHLEETRARLASLAAALDDARAGRSRHTTGH